MKTFTINNHKWLIEEKPGEELLKEYVKRTGNDSYMCNGLTFYKDHKIWIAEELCNDEKTRTLKHELTHCYIWEMGFYNVEFKWEEQICDFVASIYDFIRKVLSEDNEQRVKNCN